jgi:hypothetical protein
MIIISKNMVSSRAIGHVQGKNIMILASRLLSLW